MKFLFLKNWQGFLAFLALLTGIAFFSSGVVTGVAANWAHFSAMQKLYGIQFLFCLACLASFFIYLRQTQKTGQMGQAGPGSQGAFFVAAVTTGALLALIGQVYQTGASPWSLFALWAALMLPMLLAAPNAALALLWCVVFNTAWLLYVNNNLVPFFRHYPQAMAYAGVNLALLAVAEFNLARLQDRFRIVPRFLGFVCTWPLLGMPNIFGSNADSAAYLVLLEWCLPVAVFAAGFWFYSRKKQDFFMLANLVGFLSAYVLIRSLEIFDKLLMDSFVSILPIAGLVLLTAGLGARAINRLYRQAYPASTKSIWPVQLLLVCVTLIVSLLVALFLAVQEIPFLASGVIMLLAGVGLYFAGKGNSQRDALVSGVLVLMGLGMLGFSLLETYDIWSGHSREKNAFRLHALAIAVVCMAVYIPFRVVWVRFLCASQAISLVLLVLATYLVADISEFETVFSLLSYHTVPWMTLAATLLFLYASEKNQAGLQPLAWALAMATLVLIFMETLMLIEVLDGFPAFNLLEVIMGTLKTMFSFRVSSWPHIIFQLLPAALIVWGMRKEPAARWFKWIAAILVFLLCLNWGMGHGITYSLILVLLAYPCRDRVLAGLGVLGLIIFMGLFYYQLQLSLLNKALLLLVTGLVLLAIAIALRHYIMPVRQEPGLDGTQTGAGSARVSGKTGRYWLPVMTALSAALVLAVANWGIWSNETILRTGQRVILPLAPVDPRSLMQGDYMALNFELIGQLSKARQSRDNTGYEYAILESDENGVFSLAGISQNYPDMILANQKTVVMRYKTDGYRVSLSSHEYFFPEGKADHFAQAKYGEFRVNKKGKALLSGLLDENLNRL
ncbi:MAG: DUF4401 domain-containing protein [Alcaligenaceae bacterium]|nr:DUF4401 domain-containing protein [Alcaligenaceae bacterium]